VKLRLFSIMAFTITLTCAASVASAEEVAPPANDPAAIEWEGKTGHLRLRYNNAIILEATVESQDTEGNRFEDVEVKLQRTESRDDKDKVEQRLEFTLAEARDGATVVLAGTVTASEEAFPAETGGEIQKRFPCVRTSVGLSHSLRNNAVYDRRWDWVLIGPADGATRIAPKQDGKQRTFEFVSQGPSIQLTFHPRYYQKHKDLPYFQPWTYRVWKGSVTGYCTWWAYRHGFTQKTVDEFVELFGEKRLPDFGYHYIQLDDTYQTGNGSCPQNWLTWNPKFPGGPEYTVNKIRSIGMKPGVWVHRVHRPNDPHVADIGKQHPEWFVQKADGSLYMNGGFYLLDTTNKEAVDGMARKLFRALKKQGWDYVKIDGAGDLLYNYMNKDCKPHFNNVGSTPDETYRVWDKVAREELGPDIYILTCWGVFPAKRSIGNVDGARLSDDGFQPRTLADFNYLEGVVWRGDPDHCDILGGWLMDMDAMMSVFGREERVPMRTVVRPATCTMAGGVLMLSDKAEVYRDDNNIEGMKRCAPVLSTVPGQLYSCGRNTMEWWLQEIDRPFDHWSVLARFQWGKKREKEWVFDLHGQPEKEVHFADLGLHDDREYLVFEFWTQRYLGKHTGSFTAPAMDENNGMQVFVIREAREHPWVLSTTRHLSQGGVSLLDEKWDAASKTLFGKSEVVIGDPYVLTVHLPVGFRLRSAEVTGETVEIANQDETATVRIVPSATKTVEWKMNFAGK